MLLSWTEGDVLVNGASLHYYRLGDESGTPLVLQHGFSDNGLCWLTLAGDLCRDSPTDYDVVMPDARGHGKSARIERGERVNQAADLASLIRELRLERPILAGHSMGAGMAAQLGAQYPDLVRALVLEDPPWFAPRPPDSRGSALSQESPHAAWIKSLAGLSLEQLVERHRAEHPTWSELVLYRWSEGKQQLDPNFFAARDLGWADWREVVPAIACPTLLITATPGEGGIVTPEIAQEACEMNARISVVHIPGTGHHVRFENYTAYLAAVREFLNSLG
jgi:pimeloyl-ACP methyl ester carboxylesterase